MDRQRSRRPSFRLGRVRWRVRSCSNLLDRGRKALLVAEGGQTTRHRRREEAAAIQERRGRRQVSSSLFPKLGRVSLDSHSAPALIEADRPSMAWPIVLKSSLVVLPLEVALVSLTRGAAKESEPVAVVGWFAVGSVHGRERGGGRWKEGARACDEAGERSERCREQGRRVRVGDEPLLLMVFLVISCSPAQPSLPKCPCTAEPD